MSPKENIKKHSSMVDVKEGIENDESTKNVKTKANKVTFTFNNKLVHQLFCSGSIPIIIIKRSVVHIHEY